MRWPPTTRGIPVVGVASHSQRSLLSSSTFADLGVPLRPDQRPLAASDHHSTPSSPRPCLTPSPGATSSGAAARARARPTPSSSRWSPVSPAARSARSGAPRALILAPTRELVGQIESLAPLAAAAGLSTRTIFGGVGQNPQVTALRKGVDIVLACPGRLEDLIGQGHCRLDRVEITVLDEADHMADLGFLPAVRRLLAATPRDGQRLLFSATLDHGIGVLTKQFLNDPVTHQADPATSPVGTMTHHLLQIERDLRVPVVTDLTSASGRTVVFTRTKHGAKGARPPAQRARRRRRRAARQPESERPHPQPGCLPLRSGVRARGHRHRRSGHPWTTSGWSSRRPAGQAEAYLHRSGRTARAGNEGTVVTLMTPDQRREVLGVTKIAGIKPETTTVGSLDAPILTVIAPGERVRGEQPTVPVAAPAANPPRQRGQDRPRRAGSRSSQGGRGARRLPRLLGCPEHPVRARRRTSRAHRAQRHQVAPFDLVEPAPSSSRRCSDDDQPLVADRLDVSLNPPAGTLGVVRLPRDKACGGIRRRPRLDRRTGRGSA